MSALGTKITTAICTVRNELSNRAVDVSIKPRSGSVALRGNVPVSLGTAFGLMAAKLLWCIRGDNKATAKSYEAAALAVLADLLHCAIGCRV